MNEIWDTPINSKIEMRDAFINTLDELARTDDRIMVLDTDCMHSMGTGIFAKNHMARYLNVGIQEANGVCLAAGLSAEGFIPFINGFCTFITRRAYDQAFISCAYAGLNVKLVGWDAGVSATSNGGTHMAFEDGGIMRNIPNMTVIEPADPVAFRELTIQAAKHYGNVYIRTLRKQVEEVYKPGASFTIGKAEIIAEGTDLTIITGGMMVAKSINAARQLRKAGVSIRIVDMHTLKPLDEECVVQSAKKTGAILTVENQNVVNGLNSAVCACVSKNFPVPVERIGIEDAFGEVGDMEYLVGRFGLTEDNIVKKALALAERKNRK